jgi:hypothetical protein
MKTYLTCSSKKTYFSQNHRQKCAAEVVIIQAMKAYMGVKVQPNIFFTLALWEKTHFREKPLGSLTGFSHSSTYQTRTLWLPGKVFLNNGIDFQSKHRKKSLLPLPKIEP